MFRMKVRHFHISAISCKNREASSNHGVANNFYRVLKVKRDASSTEIKSAYFALSKEFHPDRNTSDMATRKYGLVRDAYEMLGDKKNRSAYDKLLQEEQELNYGNSNTIKNKSVWQKSSKFQQRMDELIRSRKQKSSGATNRDNLHTEDAYDRHRSKRWEDYDLFKDNDEKNSAQQFRDKWIGNDKIDPLHPDNKAYRRWEERFTQAHKVKAPTLFQEKNRAKVLILGLLIIFFGYHIYTEVNHKITDSFAVNKSDQDK